MTHNRGSVRVRVAAAGLAMMGMLSFAGIAKAQDAPRAAIETFAKDLQAHMKTLHEVGFAFGKFVGPAFKGEHVDAKAAGEHYGSALRSHAKIERTVRAAKPPNHPGAAKYHRAFLEFLDNQGKLLRHEIGSVMDILEDEKATADERKMRLEKVLADIQKAEKPQLDLMNKALDDLQKSLDAKKS